MPSMTAMTVKKYDGTTDIIYDILTKAAGDGEWAKWRQDTGNTNPSAARPELSVRTRATGKGVRFIDVSYVYPYYYTDSTTSQVVIPDGKAVLYKNGQWSVPQGISQTFVNEASAQFMNLMHHSHIRAGFLAQSSYS